MGRLVVVTGTGTEIGKTHVSVALLEALGAAGVRAAGVKPVESGVTPGARPAAGAPPTDAERLAAASSFHVKHSPVSLAAPLSPHLAARFEGVTLDPAALAASVQAARSGADVLLAELPGGLFTPLTEQALNADLAARLDPDLLLLLAPDRLGVLHDVLATLRAAAALPLRIDAVVLVATAQPDASSGTNAGELRRLIRLDVHGPLPRAPTAALAATPELGVIARRARG